MASRIAHELEKRLRRALAALAIVVTLFVSPTASGRVWRSRRTRRRSALVALVDHVECVVGSFGE
ncbi:MAG: hypothetical protein ABI591_04915 [Kofleriaceae bacterium]